MEGSLERGECVLQVGVVLTPEVGVIHKRPPMVAGGGSLGFAPPLCCCCVRPNVCRRHSPTRAEKSTGESGEPCLTPFVWGIQVSSPPAATVTPLASSSAIHRQASHGWSLATVLSLSLSFDLRSSTSSCPKPSHANLAIPYDLLAGFSPRSVGVSQKPAV